MLATTHNISTIDRQVWQQVCSKQKCVPAIGTSTAINFLAALSVAFVSLVTVQGDDSTLLSSVTYRDYVPSAVACKVTWSYPSSSE